MISVLPVVLLDFVVPSDYLIKQKHCNGTLCSSAIKHDYTISGNRFCLIETVILEQVISSAVFDQAESSDHVRPNESGPIRLSSLINRSFKIHELF